MTSYDRRHHTCRRIIRSLNRSQCSVTLKVHWLNLFAKFSVTERTAALFLAGCHTRRLNQALSVLSSSLDFLSASVVLLTRATFCFELFVCSVPWLFLLGCRYQCKWLTGKTRLYNDLQCVDGDVNPYSFTHLLTVWYGMLYWALTSHSTQYRSFRRRGALSSDVHLSFSNGGPAT